MNINRLKRDALASKLQAYGPVLIWAKSNWAHRLIFTNENHAYIAAKLSTLLKLDVWDITYGGQEHVFEIPIDSQLADVMRTNKLSPVFFKWQIIFNNEIYSKGYINTLTKRKPT